MRNEPFFLATNSTSDPRREDEGSNSPFESKASTVDFTQLARLGGEVKLSALLALKVYCV
jgi:hypothetical protein